MLITGDDRCEEEIKKRMKMLKLTFINIKEVLTSKQVMN